MVDLDIGTENLRWMGDTRFVYGFFRGVVQSRSLKARLRLDVITDDKKEMAAEARRAAADERGQRVIGGGTDPLALIQGRQSFARHGKSEEVNGSPANGVHHEGEVDDVIDDDPLPPARKLDPDDSWVTIESGRSGVVGDTKVGSGAGGWQTEYKMLYLYAGLMPWVSRDLNQWPVARAGSGVIDVSVQRVVPRGTLLSAIGHAESGQAFWLESQHYYKVRAFTAENLDKVNQPMFTVDGEAYPFDEFHVEVLPRAARFLALDGRFQHSEFLSKTDTSK